MNNFWRGHAVVEVAPGCSIENAARDAIVLAGEIDGTVYFKFNGVTLSATRNSDAQGIARSYCAHQEYESLCARASASGDGGKP